MCLTLCDHMGCRTPDFPVLHYLPEFAQTHVHWVDDAVQPSHPLSSLSPPAFNLSQHQGFSQSQIFASGGHSIGASASTSVLLMNIQGLFPLGLTGLVSLLSERLSRVFSNITVWKHQFFGTQPFLWSSSHICTWLLEIYGPLLAKWWMSLLFNILSRFVNALLWRSKQLLY